jgi:hypothetical protein
MININFKVRYKEHNFEIKFYKTRYFYNSNFVEHVSENNHNVKVYINTVLDILNTQINIYINIFLEELHIHNEIKKNNFNNISSVQYYFKNNIGIHFIINNYQSIYIF